MKRLCCHIVCFLILMSMLVSASAVSAVPDSVLNAEESVVRILAEYADGYSTGSGFVIKSDKEETLIATNYHVIEGNPYNISAWISENETVSATIFAQTSQKDMCILKLTYPVTLKSLNLATVEANQGDAVYAVGFPSAADYLSDKEAHSSSDATITNGIVSAVREATVSSYGTPTKILQINAAINSGNSGGPLFNVNGEVVGINTYGINDSQGIFGAIAVSELKAFLADNAIQISNNTNYLYWLMIAIAVIFTLCITVLIIRRKNKMKRSVKNLPSAITLREYMEAYPDGLGANDAVAMLLPVALQLRDLHDDGNVHLQVSPDSIVVGANGAYLNNATPIEAARYASGYAAPEIYKNSSAGNLSDIYSFSAILSYVATGKQPMNSLARIDAQEEKNFEQLDIAFAETLETGMALTAADRFDSMQEVVLKLSPYNVKPFALTLRGELVTTTEAPNQKKKRSAKIGVFPVVLILEIALIMAYFGCFFGAQAAAKQGDFELADRLLFVPQVTNLHSRELVAYVEAGQLMSERQYGEAKNIFKELSNYLNSSALYCEAGCRQALQYADAGNFSDALKVLATLNKPEDPDVAKTLLDVQYRQGIYLLQEEQAYDRASTIFAKLMEKKYANAETMYNQAQYQWAFALIDDEFYVNAYRKLAEIRDYADVKDVLNKLAELIFLQGQERYYKGTYPSASENFSYLLRCEETKAMHESCANYLTLIEARDTYKSAKEIVKNLTAIFYFEDAAKILLSTQELGAEFLRGTWRGADHYFTMKKNGGISYDLPWFDYGDYYMIEDGVVSLYPKGKESKKKPLFFIEAIAPNGISVYCYKNGKTYKLYK